MKRRFLSNRSRLHQQTEAAIKVRQALKEEPRPVTPAEVRDLMKIGFGTTDSALSSETTPRESTALVPGSRVGASESRGVPLSETEVPTDGLSDVFADITRRFLGTK